MRRLALAALLVICVATGAASNAAAACSHERFKGTPDAVTTIQMKVSSGEPCGVRHMTTRYGKGEQRRFPSTQMTLTGRPKNGTATISGSRVTYVSRKGYTGSDTFTYTSHHAAFGNKPARQFRYQMSVQVY